MPKPIKRPRYFGSNTPVSSPAIPHKSDWSIEGESYFKDRETGENYACEQALKVTDPTPSFNLSVSLEYATAAEVRSTLTNVLNWWHKQEAQALTSEVAA